MDACWNRITVAVLTRIQKYVSIINKKNVFHRAMNDNLQLHRYVSVKCSQGFFFSSPEHKMLRVNLSDQALSVVGRRVAAVVNIYLINTL